MCINIEDAHPLCYKTGNYDGKQSDVVLTRDSLGVIRACTCIAGVLDGSKFVDFYTTDDWEVPNVVKWAAIDELIYS